MPMQSYSDYRILVVGDGKVRVRFTPMDAKGEREDSGNIAVDLIPDINELASKVRKNYVERDIKLLGEGLYKLIFPSTVEAHFRDAYRDTSAIQNCGLRIRIEIDSAPELSILPWEFLRHPGDQHSPAFWFATHTRLVLSRYKAIREVAEALKVSPTEKIRIMLATASPVEKELASVIYKPTWETIEDLARNNDVFDVPKLLTGATPRLLDEELYAFQPHILHIIAHGKVADNKGQLALMHPDGKTPFWYGAEEFGALFESWTPGLVFLQACDSAFEAPEAAFIGIANQVVQGNVPVVVAMKYPVTNRIATQFSKDFYSALAANEPLDTAVQIGRRSIGRDFLFNSRDFGAPTLFMRVKDGRFIDTNSLKDIVKAIPSPTPPTTTLINVPPVNSDVAIQTILHNLPQKATSNFVGRQEVLPKILSLLSFTSNTSMIVIDGAGGIGKSTLALEVAYTYLENTQVLSEADRFEAIIWTSAKTSLLTADEVIPREKGINTLQDVYTVIALTLGRQDITRAEPIEQGELVRQALLNKKVLIIVDNFETMEDKRVLGFLNEVPPTVKVIITTRRRIDSPQLVHLKELTRQESINLIRSECDKRNIEISQDRAAKLYELTGGLPLAIVWSVAQMAYGHGVDITLERLSRATGDIISFCFSHSMEHLVGENARRLILALSLFASDAERPAIVQVAGLEDDGYAADTELIKLQKLCMVEKEGERFRLLPLTKRLVQFELSTDDTFISVARERLVKVILNFLISNEPILWEHGLPEGVWQREVDNVRDVIRWCRITKKMPELIDLIVAVCSFLFTYGQWQELFEIGKIGLDIINSQHNQEVDLRIKHFSLLVHIARTYVHADESEKAETYLDAAKNIMEQIAIPENLTESYYFVRAAASVSLIRPDADSILSQNLEFAQKTQVSWRVAGVKGWMGVLECKREQWEKAETVLKEAAKLCEDGNDARSLSFVYSYLTEAIYRQGRLIEADILFRMAIVIADKYAEDHNRAHLYRGMAELQRDQGKITEALVSCHQAFELYSRIGLKKEKEKTENLLKNLQERLGKEG